MKKTLAFILLSLVMVFMPVCTYAANDRLFSEVAGLPGVESVFIGQAAMRFANQSSLSAASLGNIRGSIKDVKSVEIVECDKSESIDSFKKVKALAESVIKKLNLEIIMEATDDGETTRIYAMVPENAATDTSLDNILIESSEEDEYSLVYVKGKIDISRIMGNGVIQLSSDR